MVEVFESCCGGGDDDVFVDEYLSYVEAELLAGCGDWGGVGVSLPDVLLCLVLHEALSH